MGDCIVIVTHSGFGSASVVGGNGRCPKHEKTQTPLFFQPRRCSPPPRQPPLSVKTDRLPIRIGCLAGRPGASGSRGCGPVEAGCEVSVKCADKSVLSMCGRTDTERTHAWIPAGSILKMWSA